VRQSLLSTAHTQIRLAQTCDPERLPGHESHRGGSLYRFLQQRYGFRESSGSSVQRPHKRGDPREPDREMPEPAECQALFELREGPGVIHGAQRQLTDPNRGRDTAEGVSHLFRNPDRFCGMGACLGKRSQLRETKDGPEPGEHRREEGHAQTFREQRAFEGRHRPADSNSRPVPKILYDLCRRALPEPLSAPRSRV